MMGGTVFLFPGCELGQRGLEVKSGTNCGAGEKRQRGGVQQGLSTLLTGSLRAVAKCDAAR